MEMSETEMMLKGYGLTTAEFFYHMPDYTHVLNSFVWQEYDTAPDHPAPVRIHRILAARDRRAAALGVVQPPQDNRRRVNGAT